MILPSQAIADLCGDSRVPRLVEDYNKENLRASSYDLTVGNEYYVGHPLPSATLKTEDLKDLQSFTIPPHAVCFILAKEKINLPADVSAKVSLRMTHIYAGLVLTAQPPFDPGYGGKVIVMLHNLSSDPVHMKQGDRLATIEFVRVESKPELTRGPHRSVGRLDAQLSKPIVSSLSEVARRSDSAHKKVNWIAGQMLILAALLVAVLAIPSFFSYSSLSDRVKDQDARLEKMAEELKKEREESRDAISKLRTDLERAARVGASPSKSQAFASRSQ